MTRHANEYERADHYRDERKHGPRPCDRGFEAPARSEPPTRLSPPIAGAMEVALIVKGLDNVTTAAGLIEQYAQTVAAEARLQAVIDTGERIIAQIGGSNA